MAECGPLGCWIPRRPRTKRPAGHSSCWLTSPVLADCIVHDDELEALVALCLIGASPPESDGQPLPQSTQVRSKRGAEAQQQQQSKGSSSTGLVAVGPRLAGSTRRSPKRQQHRDRQHSPASDVSSGGSLGGTLQSPATAPEWTAEHPSTEFPLADIHPAALPVDANLLQQQLSATVQASRDLPSAASSDSAQRERLWLQAGQAKHAKGPSLSCPAGYTSSAFDAHALLATSGSWSAATAPMQHFDLLAVVEKALLGSPADPAAAAAKALSAVGLAQAGIPPALATTLLQNNCSTAGSLEGGVLGPHGCPGPLMAACEALLQAGMPVGLLGQLLVGSLAAGAVQPQPLLHKPPEPQNEMSGIVRPPVKGCYWHVYIARKIAEDQRREKQLKSGGGHSAERKTNHLLEQGAVQTAQSVPPTAMGGTRVCSTGHCIEQPAPCAALRAAGSSAGGSPRKKQRLQHVQALAQQQKLLGMPGSNQLMDAGHISANVPPAVPAAAAAAGAAAQASSVSLELPFVGSTAAGSALLPMPVLQPAAPPAAVSILPDAGPAAAAAAAAAAALLLQQHAGPGCMPPAYSPSPAGAGQLAPFLALPIAAVLPAGVPALPNWPSLYPAAAGGSAACMPSIPQLHALQLMLSQSGSDPLAAQASLMAHC